MKPEHQKSSPRERKGNQRPPVKPEDAKLWDKPMYIMLLNRLDGSDLMNGAYLNITEMSRRLQRHKYTIYRWINTGRITQKGAKELIKATDGLVTKDDLFEFVMG